MNTHNLSPGLVETLRKFALRTRDIGNKVHTRRNMDLDISEYNNFQKLRYWGLVDKCRENGEHQAGYWLLTHRGGEFLRGEITLPKKVTTQDNRKIDECEERVIIYDYYRNMDMDYWQTNFKTIGSNQTALL